MNNALADLKYGFDGPSGNTPKWCTGLQALIALLVLRKRKDNERGLVTRGYVSGYRGSPLAGFDQQLEKASTLLRAHDIVFEPGMNEAFAAGAVLGTQGLRYFDANCDGVFGLWYGKHPGLLQALDAIDHGNFAGIHEHGGVLLVSGDDHGCKSSTKQSQSDFDFMARGIPYVFPGSVEEVVLLGMHAYEMSRLAGLSVGMKMVADLADSTGLIHLEHLPHDAPEFPPREYLGMEYPDGPPLSHDSLYDPKRINQIYLTQKLGLVKEYVRWNQLDRVVIDSPRARLGIVTSGTTLGEVRQALEMLEIHTGQHAGRVSVFAVAVPWPLEESAIMRFARRYEEVLVIEELRGVIEPQLKAHLYHASIGQRPQIRGKEGPARIFNEYDELDAASIAVAIAGRLALVCHGDHEFCAHLSRAVAALAPVIRETKEALPLPARKSMYCAGCPHNTSTRVPDGSKAIAGIGCHFMAKWIMPGTDLYTAMGVEGSPWLGLRHFVKDRHVFVNLGDGTFFHSGSLAIRAAVAQKARVTFKILYNDAVAMTGGQHVDGELSVAKVLALVVAEGVRRVAIVSDHPEHHAALSSASIDGSISVHHRDDLVSVEGALRDHFGVSVLLYEQTCAAEKRRRRKRGAYPDPDKRLYINPAVCEGCGDCGVASNCVAIHPLPTNAGMKRTIDQSTCNKDFSCVKGFCPSFVSLKGVRRRVHPIPPCDVREPDIPLLQSRYAIIIPGVGGTGVVTVAQILGTAAVLAGFSAAVLDKTGMAQKNGKVDSDVTIDLPGVTIAHAKIPPGGADLMIACDLVSATASDIRSRLKSGSRIAANTHATPTADFVVDPHARIDPAAHLRALSARTPLDQVLTIDASVLSERYFANTQYANTILLGAAWQRGWIPIPLAMIIHAIELNGVGVSENMNAFHIGRITVADPSKVARGESSRPSPESLLELIERNVRMLTRYQDMRLAKRYRSRVDRVFSAEQAAKGPDDAFVLTRAVAETYARLLAYKDEYEVARLYTDPEFAQRLSDEFESIDTITFHLAPPLFARKDPATGHLVKSTYGSWMLHAMRVLAKLKWLRGTRCDPFGYSRDRRHEREIITRYEEKIAVVVRDLTRENLAAAVPLVSVDAEIRGFGHVKDASLARVREREARLWEAFRDPSKQSDAPPSMFKGIRIVIK